MKTSQGVLVGLVVGALLGAFLGGTFYYGKGYEQAQADIRARMEKSGLLIAPATAPLSISGLVKSITGQTITLEVAPAFDPTAEVKPSTVYAVTIEGNTTLKSRSLNLTATPKAGQSFDPFVESKMKLADLKVGDNVIAEAGASITSFAFTAKSLTLNIR